MSDDDREQICQQLDEVVTELFNLASRVHELAAAINNSEDRQWTKNLNNGRML